MATVNEKMTALADEIRELSGASGKLGLDDMTDKVDEVNAEVNSQADLITQIKNVVDSLPNAGSGEPGGSLETIDIALPSRAPGFMVYYLDINMNLKEEEVDDQRINVLKNSIFILVDGDGTYLNINKTTFLAGNSRCSAYLVTG